jgi:hypothetical protein
MSSGYQITILPSQAITATVASTPIVGTPPAKAAHIIVHVSAKTSGGITPHVQAQDPVSGSWYDILVGADITATGTTVLKIGQGITPASNVAVSDMLPDGFRVQLVADAGTALTASVGAILSF